MKLLKHMANQLLENSVFANKIIFGRTNYSKEVSLHKSHCDFVNKQARCVIEFCKKHNIQYHIRSGTVAAADNTPVEESRN